MEGAVFTQEIGITLAVMAVAIILFITNAVRVDVVGIIMVVTLPLLNIIEAKEAISGFSSNAVISIIAVIIIGAALDKTGVMNILAKQILKLAGKSETRVIALISATVAFISSFMQNIGAAALFMPATFRISRKLNFPVSRVLMPMGFCAIIGGCLTLVGSSPLILLNDLMEKWYIDNAHNPALTEKVFEPFGLFTVTPMGIALVAAGILYFVLFGKFILPKKQAEEGSSFISSDLTGTYGNHVGKIFELEVPKTFQEQKLEVLKIRENYLSFLVGIRRKDGKKIMTPIWDDMIEPGDVIAVVSTPEHIEKLAENFHMQIKYDLEVFAEELSLDNSGIMEGMIPPRSSLIGQTFREVGIRKKYGVNPLVLFRNGKLMLENISALKVRAGDAFLLQGSWKKFHILKDKKDFVFTQDVKGELIYPEKAKLAVTGLVLALTLAIGFNVQLSIALLTGALFMILSKVITIDEAYKAVDWMTVFLLAGLIPLGIAFQKTGAANYIAVNIMDFIGAVSPLVLLAVIGGLTSFFTLVTSNVGATVLLVPLCMNMALKAGIDPQIAALTVGIAASNTFVLPTHQVNALIMRPGGYKPSDYVKAGTGMTIIYIAVVIAMLFFYYM
ncbi:SLC13 family permease [Thermodesulfobacteriota bacterium]